MAVRSIVAFWGVSLLLIAVPGADWAFTLGTVLGGRSVLLAVGGLTTGYIGMTLVVAVGVGALVDRTPSILTALTVAGGFYLIWQGARQLARRRVKPLGVPADVGARSAWAAFVQGAGVSGLNPKGLLVFLALLPQFTRPGFAWPLATQFAFLGLVFVLTCAAFYLTLGTLARGLLVRRPGLAAVATRLSGAGMVAVGGALLLERLLS